MPISPKVPSLFLRFSVPLLLLIVPSAALPPDDLHLFATIFIVLFICAIVISFGFAASLYLFCRNKNEKCWKNSQQQFVPWAIQPTKIPKGTSPHPPTICRPVTKGQKVATVTATATPTPNALMAFCSNALRNALAKISTMLKRGGPTPPSTHFPSESPQPSYISVMSPDQLSPQQYQKFSSPPPQNGQMPSMPFSPFSSSSSRLRSILKKPKTVSAALGPRANDGAAPATTVSYRIPVLRAQNVPMQKAPPQVPSKWEWNAHLWECPRGVDRVVEDRVEREECLRDGQLMAVERLTRTIRASADIANGHRATTAGTGATYI